MNVFDYSPWISPVTGKGTISILPDLDDGYIWSGSITGTPNDPSSFVFRPMPSPDLIDMKIDLIGIERDLVRFANQSIDISRLPVLSYGVLPMPSDLPEFFPIPNPTFGGSVTDPFMSNPLYPQIFASSYRGTKDITDPTYPIEVLKRSNWLTSVSNSFGLAQFKIEQALARSNLGKFIVQKRDISYNWPNKPALALIPDALKAMYGLGDTYTFQNAQALDEIAGLPGIAKIDQDGAFSLAMAGDDYVDPAQLDESIAQVLETLETELGILQGEIATLEGLIDLVGLLALLADGLSLASLLSSLLNRQDQTEQNISNITQEFEQFTYHTLNNIENILKSDYFYDSVSSIVENLFSSSLGEKTVQIVARVIENTTFQPRNIELLSDHILIGNSINEAIPIPAEDLGFMDQKSLLGVTGDVTFLIFGDSYISKIKDDPVFYGSSITIPVGNTASRPVNPTIGMIRFNTDLQ